LAWFAVKRRYPGEQHTWIDLFRPLCTFWVLSDCSSPVYAEAKGGELTWQERKARKARKERNRKKGEERKNQGRKPKKKGEKKVHICQKKEQLSGSMKRRVMGSSSAPMRETSLCTFPTLLEKDSELLETVIVCPSTSKRQNGVPRLSASQDWDSK